MYEAEQGPPSCQGSVVGERFAGELPPFRRRRAESKFNLFNEWRVEKSDGTKSSTLACLTRDNWNGFSAESKDALALDRKGAFL